MVETKQQEQDQRIEEIFMKLINEIHPTFKPMGVKNQTYGNGKVKTTFSEVFSDIILKEVEKTGYYK